MHVSRHLPKHQLNPSPRAGCDVRDPLGGQTGQFQQFDIVELLRKAIQCVCEVIFI